jgi:hypothetical protein
MSRLFYKNKNYAEINRGLFFYLGACTRITTAQDRACIAGKRQKGCSCPSGRRKSMVKAAVSVKTTHKIHKKFRNFDRYILRFLQPCGANFNNALSIPVEGHSLIPRHVFRRGRASGLAKRKA